MNKGLKLRPDLWGVSIRMNKTYLYCVSIQLDNFGCMFMKWWITESKSQRCFITFYSSVKAVFTANFSKYI